MAAADYYLCDVCGGKCFYDANLGYDYDVHNPITGMPKLGYMGDMAAICDNCATTHEVVVREKSEAQTAPVEPVSAVNVPEGLKLVPVNYTPEMRAAWDRAPQSEDDDRDFNGAYRAMIEAAPAAPVESKDAKIKHEYVGFIALNENGNPEEVMQEKMMAENWIEHNPTHSIAAAYISKRYCDACEQHVTAPCNSVDCSTPELPWSIAATAQQNDQSKGGETA